jgi:NADH dehydrogenase
MTHHRICILGGTGFVGRHLAARLNRLGIPTRILTRRRDRHRDLLVLPLCEVVETDVYDPEALRRAFQDCDRVVNLVGILNESGHDGAGFRKAHLELARTVLGAAQKSGIRRLLHMSALGANAGTGPSFYLRSKGEAEDYLHTFHDPVELVTFRPSVIFGPGDGLFNRFARLLKLTPGLFPLARAETRFAPVYIGDVLDRFIEAITEPVVDDKRIELCGPEIFTLRELVEYTARVTGLKRRVIALPRFAAVMQAFVMEYFVPGKPFSLDNYNSLKIDSVCTRGPTMPTAVEAVVPQYLGQYTHRGRYRRFRATARRELPQDR